MKQKVLFFDVDGTIMTADHIIPPSAAEALRLVSKAGHIMVVNTGRPFRHIQPSIKAMPFAGYVCSLGGHIVYNDKVLYHFGFSPEESARFRDLGLHYGMQMFFESEKGIAFAEGTYPKYALKDVEGLTDFDLPVIHNIFDSDFAFDKFICWGTDEAATAEFIRTVEPELDVVHREKGMLECVHKGFSKANGMKTMLNLLGYDSSDAIAFGDSNNDLPMLQLAKIGVAMGNSQEELKKQADFVTDDINNDGLYNALNRLGLFDCE